MAALPPRGNLDGSAINQTGVFQAAIGSVYDFLSGLLGTAGTKVEAQKTLGVSVVDRVYAELIGFQNLSAFFTNLTTSPPSISQGTQIFSVSLAPKSVTNKLRVTVVVPWSSTQTLVGEIACAAVFLNGGAVAPFSAIEVLPFDGYAGTLAIQREWVPGTTAAQTIAVRVGCQSSNFLIGGNRYSPLGGSTQAASIVVEEITA